MSCLKFPETTVLDLGTDRLCMFLARKVGCVHYETQLHCYGQTLVLLETHHKPAMRSTRLVMQNKHVMGVPRGLAQKYAMSDSEHVPQSVMVCEHTMASN